MSRSSALPASQPTTQGARYASAAQVSWTEAGGDLVLFDGQGGTYVALNASSSAIWRAAVKGLATDEISAQLAARFNAEPAALNRDVTQFLAQMAARGLILEIL